MAEKDKASQAAVVVSVGAAITAALALLQKRAQAAPPEGVVQLPQELWNLIIAIAKSIDSVDIDLDTVITELGKLSINVQGYVPNAERITTVRTACTVVTQPYQLPSITIPDDMQLLLLAWPLNPGWVFVGPTAAECVNINQSYPLPPGATVAYRVKNADSLYISANAVPSWVVATTEQRRG